jgi:hypothetical protein
VARDVRRRQFLIGGLGVAATAAGLGAWLWSEFPHTSTNTPARLPTPRGDQVVLEWNSAALRAIRDLQPVGPFAARSLAIVHTCMFDAWAAYDATALGTQFEDRLRRPEAEQTAANKAKAVSFAAYRALVDLFPTEQEHLAGIMTRMGYTISDISTSSGTPAGIGNITAQAVLALRHQDGSNQLGNLHPGAYSDYTKYPIINTPEDIKDPNRWQPLEVPEGKSGSKVQTFVGAQWANVTPFALSSPSQFLAKTGPARHPGALYSQQADEILQYSAGLTDEHKVIAEYWSGTSTMNQPSTNWSLFAQLVAQRDAHTLDQNVKLFFALSNALLDASIATWTAKRAFDSPYPLTAIHYLDRGKQVQAWAGPGKGTQSINGAYWQPYQPQNLLAPPYPEYCSEHSSFSTAAAEILTSFTGNDQFGMSYTWPAHSSQVEQGIPAQNVRLAWRTFSLAAEQAGLSQRYSGTHFAQSDLDGRELGQKIGNQVWQKALTYFNSSGKL